MRVALYFTPPPDTELTRLAARWLGRDAFSGQPTRPEDPRLDPLVAAPARYGFHATMKAPFRLADTATLAALEQRLAGFCAEQEAVSLPELRLQQLGDFLALVPGRIAPELLALEAAVVRDFDDFRAPLLPQEIEARRPERLSARQRSYLHAWGYPFVLEEFRFHMTLTGPLPSGEETGETGATGETGELLQELRETLAAPLARRHVVDRLALFVEPAPGAPFLVHSHHAFGAARTAAPAAPCL